MAVKNHIVFGLSIMLQCSRWTTDLWKNIHIMSL